MRADVLFTFDNGFQRKTIETVRALSKRSDTAVLRRIFCTSVGAAVSTVPTRCQTMDRLVANRRVGRWFRSLRATDTAGKIARTSEARVDLWRRGQQQTTVRFRASSSTVP